MSYPARAEGLVNMNYELKIRLTYFTDDNPQGLCYSDSFSHVIGTYRLYSDESDVFFFSKVEAVLTNC